MKTFFKSLTAVAVASAALTSMPAHAVLVTFGGNNATQIDIDTGLNVNAGKTSAVAGYINAATNTVTGANVFLETFDALATGNNQYGFPTRPTLAGGNSGEVQFQPSPANGGFVSLNPSTPANGGDLTISNGTGFGMGIRKGTTGFAAAPGGDCSQNPNPGCNATYYAYGPGQGGQLPSGVKVSFASLLAAYGPGYAIDYLGVFYGSVDTYNEIRFYDTLDNLISGTGELSDGILTGTEILTALSLSSGNQINSNVYVNLGFQPGEKFSSFEFYTTGVAFEIDNVVTHVGQVIPEPGSLVLISLGLFGMAGLRRKKA